jgi:hypothetical protein
MSNSENVDGKYAWIDEDDVGGVVYAVDIDGKDEGRMCEGRRTRWEGCVKNEGVLERRDGE